MAPFSIYTAATLLALARSTVRGLGRFIRYEVHVHNYGARISVTYLERSTNLVRTTTMAI